MKTTLFLFIFLWLISCGENNSSTSNLDPCSPNQCEKSLIPHKTVCKKLSDSDFECMCEDGYTDDNGSCKAIEITPCTPNPCLENYKTICTANNDDYTCSCDDGYQENNGNCLKLEKLHLRFVTANTTSSNDGYYHSEGIRMLQAVNADVIMIQEFLYLKHGDGSKNDKIRQLVDKACGENCYYHLGEKSKPNGIISKYPILKSGGLNGESPDRNLDWAIIDIPGKKDLYVFSVHLHTSPGSDQVKDAVTIVNEIKTIKNTYPDKYYYIVGGDFNGTSSVSSNGFGKYNTFTTNSAKPISENCRNSKSSYACYRTNATRTKHLDFILTSPDLSPLQVSSKFCKKDNDNDCISYPTGTVFDTRECLSVIDYFTPATANDSGAIGMQHMSVVKDFEIEIKE